MLRQALNLTAGINNLIANLNGLVVIAGLEGRTQAASAMSEKRPHSESRYPDSDHRCPRDIDRPFVGTGSPAMPLPMTRTSPRGWLHRVETVLASWLQPVGSMFRPVVVGIR